MMANRKITAGAASEADGLRAYPEGRLARYALLLSCLGVFFLSGCASVGPPSVARDRFDYAASISDSWKRQMLLNLLKVRYADAPVFLDVTSVINSYTLSGSVNLSLTMIEKTAC